MQLWCILQQYQRVLHLYMKNLDSLEMDENVKVNVEPFFSTGECLWNTSTDDS